jgi:hypothetical protein
MFKRVNLLPMLVGRFSRLLETSPHIAQYVMVLGIQEDPGFEMMSVIAPKLTNVHSLTLNGVNFIKLSNSTRSLFITSFSYVRSLVLNGCMFKTTREFHSFFIAFPHLQALELHCSGANEYVGCEDENIFPSSGSPYHLRSLSLDHAASICGFVDPLVLSGALLSLQTFRLCDASLSENEVASVGRLLLSVGSALEHLELSLWSVGKHSRRKYFILKWLICTTEPNSFPTRNGPIDVNSIELFSANHNL